MSLKLFIVLLTGALSVFGGTDVSLEADGRWQVEKGAPGEVALHAAALTVRQNVADAKGDRWYFSGMLEVHDNASEWMVHELYGRYKGPLGVWNITLGRFSLPFGLLYSYNTDRLPFELPLDASLGVEGDNGVMFSGVKGMYDYALAVSQGYGHHHTPDFPGHGLVTGRIGITPGDTEELSFGLSAAGGKTAMHHHKDRTVERYLGAVDVTAYWAGFLNRFQAGGGAINGAAFADAFAAIEYALLPSADLLLSTTFFQTGGDVHTSVFCGFAYKPAWFTLRGGYGYEYSGTERHQAVVQVYRLFNRRF